MKMTLGSLFDGIGGFPFAAEELGIKAVWASEIVTHCISITKKYFPDMKHLGDITKINGADIEPVDIITFGSPCQGLSNAGHRAGLKDERSGLFLEAVRIIKEMRDKTNGNYPKFIVWENVDGALSSCEGEDFQTVIEKIAGIAECGVSIPRPPENEDGRLVWKPAGAVLGEDWSLAWRVLDAKYWGVPQRRKRVFLVGDFRGSSAGEILFKPEGEGWHSKSCQTKRSKVAGCGNKGIGINEAQYAVDFGRTADRIQVNPKLAVTLQSEGGGVGAKTGLYCLPAYCIQDTIIGRSVTAGANGKGIKKEECFTLTAFDCHAVAAYSKEHQNFIIRRLTPKECERLFGFPDDWTFYGIDNKQISDDKRTSALGNSVAIPCVLRVLEGIQRVFQ